jgi:NAD dependent epimerase/dehydratase family enzyme
MVGRILAYQLFEKQMTVHTLVHNDPQAQVKRVSQAQPANNIADLLVDFRINLGDVILMRGWHYGGEDTC